MRKRRTRNHVLADLSVNHVEKQALLCGFSVERVEHDYGVDCVIYTYDSAGNVTREVDGRGIATDYAVNALNQVVQTLLALRERHHDHADEKDQERQVEREGPADGSAERER